MPFSNVNVRSPYTVSYNSGNHWSVLTQTHGSQWPQVLPYCLLNVGLMILLEVSYQKIEAGRKYMEITSQGHSFITLVVSFLLVSRVTTALGRYNAARDALESMYRGVRDLVQTACVLTGNDKSPSATEWRHLVAYRSLIMLKTSMVVVEYPADELAPWNVPELNGVELDDVKSNNLMSANNRRWAHSERTAWEESMRVPIRIAYLLRKSIHLHNQMLQEPLIVNQELNLLGSVDAFMGGYYNMCKFLTTPVPFPLIQMSRTFLFIFVYSVPFVMLSDHSNAAAHCFVIFLLTYGFVGLEFVAIELDNPFGHDPNDFKNSAMANTAYEDIYLTILDVDGSEATDKLRLRMHSGNSAVSSEQSWLLSPSV